MADLTYVVPDKPQRPFAAGDVVEVMDRTGLHLGDETVVQVTRRSVKTRCGRSWTLDGWWLSWPRSYPFPWIRHKAK